ncbi:hypothetical protein SCUCBS95973_005157 [Sporothrix curviconia]|uniref:Zn(2)-C6 fungal-type domain-containing protein n=1 Tax=Sporothrix curviconia TaxID=1260050 RepID=A0ABP0BUX6_9PEZI
MAPSSSASSELPSAALLRLMRRRVPPEKRQRTEMSCDWCKKKRCKCLRGSTSDTCRACSEIGRPCTTTEPRKRRVYGSLSASSSAPFSTSQQRTSVAAAVAAVPSVPSAASSSSSSSSPTYPALAHSPRPDVIDSFHDMGIDLSTTDPRLLLTPQLPPQQQPTTIAPRELVTHHRGNSRDTPSSSTAQGMMVVARKRMQPPPPPPPAPAPASSPSPSPSPSQHRHQHQQKRLCDERLFEDALGFPRYIGPLGSYTLLVKLWEVMAVWCAPMTHRDSAQTMGHSQPMMRLADGSNATNSRSIDLPPREVADVLVALFFDKVHCDFPLFHRALFQASYENMWSPPSPHTSSSSARRHPGPGIGHSIVNPDTEPAWLMCLSMVFVLGLEAASAQSSAIRRLVGNTARREALKAGYLGKAQEMLPDVIAGSMLVHVQALMLYCRYLHITRSRNACWNLTGAAIRVAVAIGLHRNGVHGKCSPLERELRRRIWWTLYAFERIECSSLGRTSAIDDAECNVGVPTEGLLDMSDILPLGYVGVHAELMTLLGSICKHQYGGSSGGGGASTAASTGSAVEVPCDQIEFALASSAALDQWHVHLPAHVQLHADAPASHQRAILLLHVQHHYTVTLLCRPFLLALVAKKKPATATKGASSASKRRHQAGNSIGVDASASPLLMFARKCIDAAKAAVAVLDRLFRAGLFNSKTWWDVYFIEASCMVLALGRFVNDRDLRNDAGILDALRTCIHILKECKEFSPTMHRFAVVTTDFAQALVADTNQDDKQDKDGKNEENEDNDESKESEENESQSRPRKQQQKTHEQTGETAPEQVQGSVQRQTQEQRPAPSLSRQRQHHHNQPAQQAQRQQVHRPQYRQEQQPQYGQPQQYQGPPMQQQFVYAGIPHNGHSMRPAYNVREADDVNGEQGAASTAGSQSGSSPDDSFISFVPGHIAGGHDPNMGGTLQDPFSMPWNLADISQLWGDFVGDFVEPSDHWWQQG